MAAYTQVHRFVLQAFTREFAFDVEELCKEVQKAGDRSSMPLEMEPRALDPFISAINVKLSEYNLGLNIKKQMLADLDGKIYYVLVNTRADELSKTAGSEFKDSERTLFKIILEHLATSEHGDITIREARKLANQNDVTKNKFPGMELDKYLQRLAERKWLRAHPKEVGRYTGGPRTLVEMQSTLGDLGAEKDENSGLYVLQTSQYRRQGGGSGGDARERDDDEDAAGDDSSVEDERTANGTQVPQASRRRSRQPQNYNDDDDEEDDDEASASPQERARGKRPRRSRT